MEKKEKRKRKDREYQIYDLLQSIYFEVNIQDSNKYTHAVVLVCMPCRKSREKATGHKNTIISNRIRYCCKKKLKWHQNEDNTNGMDS